MNSEFRTLVDSLRPKFDALMAITPVRYERLPRLMPERGIYLFSEGDLHLYVGRTNRLRQRLAGHCRPSSNHFSATFAFRIARKDTGLQKATYSTVTKGFTSVVPLPGSTPSVRRSYDRYAKIESVVPLQDRTDCVLLFVRRRQVLGAQLLDPIRGLAAQRRGAGLRLVTTAPDRHLLTSLKGNLADSIHLR